MFESVVRGEEKCETYQALGGLYAYHSFSSSQRKKNFALRYSLFIVVPLLTPRAAASLKNAKDIPATMHLLHHPQPSTPQHHFQLRQSHKPLFLVVEAILEQPGLMLPQR
jgi:hypothetical protein